MAITVKKANSQRDHATGLGALFRSPTVATIVRYVAARRLQRIRVSALEREIFLQAKISRGAINNALVALEEADLIKRQKNAGVVTCEIMSPKLWTKLGELFDAEVQPETTTVGMPWLADLVAGKPRREGFRPQPASTESEVPLEAVETMLTILPEVEPSVPTRRSAAPGRRR